MKFPRLEMASTGVFRRELNSLSRENDPELYYSGLLNLGQRLAQRNDSQGALPLFHFVQTEAQASLPDLARRAAKEIETLEGRGPFGNRVEFLNRQFLRELTSPSALVGMAGAQAVFGLARAGILLRLSKSPISNLWTRGFGAKALAATGAFALEAPSFVAFTHATNAGLGIKQDGNLPPLSQELASSFLTLGALKLTGWAGGALYGKVAGMRGTALQGAFTQTSMLGGILLAHRLEELGQLRPATDSASSVLDAFALLLQFNAAGRLLQAGLGPRWTNFHRELHSRSENLTRPLRLAFSLELKNTAFATAAASSKQVEYSHILQMQSAKDIVAQAPPSVQELIESAKKQAKDASRTYSSEDTRLLHETARLLLLKEPESLLPEEKKFLIAVGNHALNEYQKTGDRYYLAMQIFSGFDHYPGLKRIARTLEADSYYRYQCLLKLEDYENALKGYDLMTREMEFFPNAMDDIYGEAIEIVRADLRNHSRIRGYESPPTFSLTQTAGNLTQLAASYDLMIAIAKGGLFSGAVADFMGLPVRVIEIHAHNRRNPTTKFVDEISPEDITGKRVLLLDKDLITGATIREAYHRLQDFSPAALGVYFNYNIQPPQATRSLRQMNIALHFPKDIERPASLPFFYYAHEKARTPLGRFHQAMRGFEPLRSEKIVHDYLEKQQQIFFAFNPLLPGVSAIRAMMASRLEGLLKSYEESRKIGENLAHTNLIGIIKTDPMLPLGFAENLARGRYHSRALELAEARGVKNIHSPHSYSAAFRLAQLALKDRYDLALIVGPEGFAYEPIFQDLGMETVAVNIPEANFGGKRSIATFENLGKLQGKKVLVIEDDIRSGATLQKLLEEIQVYHPRSLGLYLGLPAMRQMTENIPKAFKKVYIADTLNERDEAAFLKHLKKRETVFKAPLPRG